MSHSYKPKARENAFLVLYRWDLRGEKISSLVKEFLDERNTSSDKVIGYMVKLLDTTMENLTDIDKLISEHLEDWEFDRLGYVERNLLRLGIGELFFLERKPSKGVITSYVALARKYADENARRFVNGILGSMYREAALSFKGKEQVNEQSED